MMNLLWIKNLSGQHVRAGGKPLLLRRLRHGVLFFYFLTLLMVLLATAWLSLQDYRNTLQEAERQSLSLARSLEEHTTRSLVSVEQAMQNLVEDFGRAGGVERMDEHWAHERLKSKVELTPQIRAIIAMDAKGILQAHGLEYPTRRVNLSDRTYFSYHQNRNDIRLRIGEPIISRTDYKWLIPVTRRINTPDNSFGGVMLSGVEPDYFLHFYDSLHLDRGTRIQLMRSDGILLLNYPLDITLLGTNLRDNDPDGFARLQASNTAFLPKPRESGKQFIAQLASADMPIVVRIITDGDHVLAKFSQDTRVRIASATLVLLIMTSMLFLLLRQIHRVEDSESRLHLTQFAVDESPDMILWCDQNGRVRYANRRLAELSQHTPTELLGLAFADLIGNGDLRWEKLHAELQAQQRLNLESVLRRKSGALVPVELTLSLIADKQRQYLCITARDITERHAAQQELRRHRDHLQDLVAERTAEIRTMLDANPLAIVLSVHDHMQLVNPAFEALFGYSMNSISGLPESLIHASAASHSTVRSAIQSRISLGGTYRGEAELRRSDGSLFWAMLFARAVQPDEPERGVIFIIEDVSAQRAAALALRQSEQLKRSVLDTTTDGFALIDHQRRFVDVNQALCRQLGISRITMLGQTPETIWSEPLASQIFPKQPGRQEQPAQLEVELPVHDGQKHPFLVSHGVIHGERGEIEHTFAFLTDIAYQKEIERSLVEAKDAAETANHAKSIFLTNMSHELRTPMHAILSFSEMGLQKTQVPQEADLARYFERIQNSGKRLLTLLNDLLDMSRMEADKMRYDKARHFLQNTLQAAATEVSSLLSAKRLSIEINDKLPRIAAVYDRVRITQVIINLLSNAIRFSPPGGCIHIAGLHETADDGTSWVGFTLRDEGPGIPQAELERIFDSFEQSSQSQPVGGTGLGLTISRRIMLDHGGSILASNHPDGGAVFTVRLPGEQRAQTSDASPVTPEA
ncbi:PAS domain S-box protein [Uliginosibacterium sp. 31-16]|uniref:PAS domain S-box protein n=1 Tax=Uliginosibacterium sp. 31-16 TaxID=3068315 RepID=UPI00273E91E5|nr:PAS domain S-box protein [Uliginosibacterium sp. 31-16]MDP5239703.1 PAS domain S-box protein [Uliginosibacterium sp. 31-16]